MIHQRVIYLLAMVSTLALSDANAAECLFAVRGAVHSGVSFDHRQQLEEVRDITDLHQRRIMYRRLLLGPHSLRSGEGVSIGIYNIFPGGDTPDSAIFEYWTITLPTDDFPTRDVIKGSKAKVFMTSGSAVWWREGRVYFGDSADGDIVADILAADRVMLRLDLVAKGRFAAQKDVAGEIFPIKRTLEIPIVPLDQFERQIAGCRISPD